MDDHRVEGVQIAHGARHVTAHLDLLRVDQLHLRLTVQEFEGGAAVAELRDDAQGPRVQAHPIELHLRGLNNEGMK